MILDRFLRNRLKKKVSNGDGFDPTGLAARVFVNEMRFGLIGDSSRAAVGSGRSRPPRAPGFPPTVRVEGDAAGAGSGEAE